MISNIYTDKILKYPLTTEEYNQINEAWKFINIFNKPYIYITDYRNYLIKSINKEYDVEKFNTCETIVNKMFWNLRWLLFPLFQYNGLSSDIYYKIIENNYGNYKEIPNNITGCNNKSYEDIYDLENKIHDFYFETNNFYRSFINKLITIDKTNKQIYFRNMEASSDIFSKNYFNLLTITILFNKKLYEKIMTNPYMISKKTITVPYYYFEQDYGFPNLNYCRYSIGNNDERLNRINKMYFETSDAKNWFKIIL